MKVKVDTMDDPDSVARFVVEVRQGAISADLGDPIDQTSGIRSVNKLIFTFCVHGNPRFLKLHGELSRIPFFGFRASVYTRLSEPHAR